MDASLCNQNHHPVAYQSIPPRHGKQSIPLPRSRQRLYQEETWFSSLSVCIINLTRSSGGETTLAIFKVFWVALLVFLTVITTYHLFGSVLSAPNIVGAIFVLSLWSTQIVQIVSDRFSSRYKEPIHFCYSLWWFTLSLAAVVVCSVFDCPLWFVKGTLVLSGMIGIAGILNMFYSVQEEYNRICQMSYEISTN